MKLKLKRIAFVAALIFSVNLCNAAFPVKSAPPETSQELLNNNIADGITEAEYAPAATAAYSPAAPHPAPGRQQQGSGLAIASLACSVTGLFIAGIPLGLAGIILGVLGMSGNRPLKGLAIAGLIIGIVDVVVVAAYLSTL